MLKKFKPHFFNPFHWLIKPYLLWLEQRHLAKWQKKQDYFAKKTKLDTLFLTVDGFKLSQQARIEKPSLELTYGETDLLGFLLLLNKLSPSKEDIFLDLGSGLGQLVIATPFFYPVKKAIGIEYLTALSKAANQIKTRLPIENQKKTILLNQHILDSEIGEATIIFCTATAFFGDSWQKIQNHLTKACYGTRIITLSKPLTIDGFKLIYKTWCPTSWGASLAYVHIRLSY